MNDKRFIIPALLAATLHAALILLLGRTPISVAVVAADPAIPVVKPVPLEPAALPPDPADADPALAPVPNPRGGPAPDSQNENLTPPPSPQSPVVPVDIRPYRRIKTDWETIPLGPPGDPAGDPNAWGPSTNGPIGVDGLDRVPRTLVQVAPDYPYEMRRNGTTGTVWVTMIVGPDGSVREAYATRSTHREFEASTVRAVKHWRFEPGKKNGRPTSFRLAVPVQFNLDPI